MQDPQAELPPTPTDTPTIAAERIHLQMPVDVRSASLAVLAVLATVYTLYWAKAVFVPIMLGVIISYALTPAVDRMQRWHVPRSLGISILLVIALGGIGATGYSLADDVAEVVESLPAAAQKLRQSMRKSRSAPASPIETVQRAASELEEAAEAGSEPRPGRGVTRVQIEKPRFNIRDYLWSGTLGLAEFIAQAVAVIFLVYFIVAAGDTFRRKLVHIAGPTLTRKKITVQVLDEINQQIQRYLMVQIYTSVMVGVATGLAVWALGLERALVWGIVAGVLNLIPYIGSLIVAGALALVGFLQFGQLNVAVQLVGASLVIHTISGNLIAPLMTSRACRMNPVVIFVGVLAFGWLWGIWGLLLGAPLLMAIKTVCDRVDEFNPVGELLGA